MAELVRAVRAEIQADLRSDGGNGGITLTGGQRVGGVGSKHEYLFEAKLQRSPFQGPDVLVRSQRSRSEWVPGKAVWTPDGRVRLTTAADFGQRTPELRIRDDETTGLVLLTEKLERIGEGNDEFNLTSAGWMVARGRPSVGRARNPQSLVRGYRGLNLNSHQRQAIEHALGSEVTFIWGPPGTGKTEVVSRIMEGCHRQGHTVLFVAPTNVAVDQALERVCELLSQEEGFESGLVQRSGQMAVASLEAKFGDAISPDRIAERLSAQLNQERTNIEQALTQARDAVNLHTRAAELQETLQNLHAVVTGHHSESHRAQQQLAVLRSQIVSARAEIDEIGIPTGIFAPRKRTRLDELRREVAFCEAEEATIKYQLEEADRAARTAHDQLAALEPTLREARDRLSGVPTLKPLQEAVTRLTEEQKRLDQELAKIADAVRARCRILGTTVAKAVQSRKLLDTVDVVVIDEAGMVSLPQAWYAAGLARRRVVVAGDFRQLPAVTKGSGDRLASPEDKVHCREWMDRDVFHSAGLVDQSGSVRRDGRLVPLVEQYRMRPAICAVVNTVAYPDAPLMTGRSDTSRLPRSPLIESPLVLVDTGDQRRALFPQPVRNGHKTNPVHEAVIHELIRGLQADTVLPAYQGRDEGLPTDRLAVIAPFRDQVGILQKSISHRFGSSFEGLVDTVHRFQGSQRPLVIIDTVAGIGDRVGYFYEHTGLSSHTCRLLNVALSRAQDHLMVVADVDYLTRQLAPNSETRRMLDHLLHHAQRLPVGDLVPIRMASDLAGLSDTELVRPAFFPKDEVRRAVAWDIDRAAESIEIYCAFLDDRAVRSWIERLARRVSEGIRVVVHTRDHQQGTKGDQQAARLRAAGCQVHAREQMHEKVLIVDDEILWHGSLNLLANSGPTDLMMRITSRASCARVKQIMTRARSERPSPAKHPAQSNQHDWNSRSVPKPSSRVRRNKYAAACANCSTWVQANGGALVRRDDVWLVYCQACSEA